MMTWVRERMEATGSTRAVGLMRILLAALIASRWAGELMPVWHQEWWYWVLALFFYPAVTCMFFGIYSRWSTGLTAVVVAVMVWGFGWYGGVHDWIHHHTHLLMHATLLIALTPNGRSFSFDRWRAVGRAERDGTPVPAEIGPLWAVSLLAVQVSAVYFYSAIDKTTLRFLSGDHLRGIFAVHYTGSEAVEVPGFGVILLIGAVAVVALEYALPFALFVRRWQWFLFPLGLLFHGMLYILLPVGTFTCTMLTLYLAYAHPDDVHSFVDRLLKSP